MVLKSKKGEGLIYAVTASFIIFALLSVLLTVSLMQDSIDKMYTTKVDDKLAQIQEIEDELYSQETSE